MKWKRKAMIQNLISVLPSNLSYELYYFLQRNFGSLKDFDPSGRLNAGAGFVKFINQCGHSIKNKTVFELGTGRAPFTPLAFWLAGADKIITADLNPYVKPVLFKEGLDIMFNHKNKIFDIFGELLIKEKFKDLEKFHTENHFDMNKHLSYLNIEYIAPCNAVETGLEENSVDYFVSCAVLEHIDNETLKEIIKEGNRIVRNDGVFINYIDYKDHFCSSDPSISAINFLKYSDEEWVKYAGNRYMYMNRLRHDDYIELFENSGHQILKVNPTIDKRSAELLNSGKIIPDKRFSDKKHDILEIKEALIASKTNN